MGYIELPRDQSRLSPSQVRLMEQRLLDGSSSSNQSSPAKRRLAADGEVVAVNGDEEEGKDRLIQHLEEEVEHQRQLRLSDAKQVETKAARIKDWVTNKLRELEEQNRHLRAQNEHCNEQMELLKNRLEQLQVMGAEQQQQRMSASAGGGASSSSRLSSASSVSARERFVWRLRPTKNCAVGNTSPSRRALILERAGALIRFAYPREWT